MFRRTFSPGKEPSPSGGRWTAEGRTDEGTGGGGVSSGAVPCPAGRVGAGDPSPHSLLSWQKRTLQRGFSCPFGAIHLPGRGRWKRKPPGRQNAPAGAFCRNTGVVRSGLAGVDRPVDPAPDRSREEPGPRITTAAEGRGGKSHLPLLLFPRVPLCYALARRSCWPCTLPWRSKYPGAAWTVRRIDVGGRRFELLLFPLPLLGRLRKVPTAALDPELRCCIGRFSFCFFSRGCFPPAKCFPVCHTAGGCGR